MQRLWKGCCRMLFFCLNGSGMVLDIGRKSEVGDLMRFVKKGVGSLWSLTESDRCFDKLRRVVSSCWGVQDLTGTAWGFATCALQSSVVGAPLGRKRLASAQRSASRSSCLGSKKGGKGNVKCSTIILSCFYIFLYEMQFIIYEVIWSGTKVLICLDMSWCDLILQLLHHITIWHFMNTHGITRGMRSCFSSFDHRFVHMLADHFLHLVSSH